MGIKSTRTIYKSTALDMIRQEFERITNEGSCKEIEEFLENVLDIHNEKSRYYFDNFYVVPDDYKPQKWENVC